MPGGRNLGAYRIQGNIVPALLEEMKHVRGIGQFRRLQHIISILRVHVARQCGSTDSVEEIRETREAVQMERQCKWRGWSIWFRGKRDRECRISGLMWAGHVLADEQGFRDQLGTMMNELMLKIMKLGIQQEPESL